MFLKEGEHYYSPTVTLEGFITILMIAAFEGRKVVSFDVPGAFLQAELPHDELVLLKLRGRFVDIMCEINPEHKPNVRYENGVKVLYMKVIRAIYGCIESALAWYDLFTNTLKSKGFELNPYDKCIANKMYNGKQCTIAWPVDDNVATHEDQEVIDEIKSIMVEHFGEMKFVEGEEHTFLGMKITIKDKKVMINMRDQINETIDKFEADTGEIVKDSVKSPANHSLFLVDEGAKELDENKSDIFHSTTAKLLYIMKRARPDIETSISFLSRRVSKSADDDWKKLKRVLGWLKRTIDDIRTIGATSLTELYTYIDAAFAVHDNMRSHTGGAISMGYGIVHGKSSMQKINTKSSTEAELVGISEYVPYNLWLLHFLDAQGYGIKDNVVYQDNQSTICMAKNGRDSTTGNSRHINIRYFFVKNRIDKGEMRVDYLPTNVMLADYFTKPLMGKRFMDLREYVMGWKIIMT